jgi:HEAT repeat protein
VAWALGAIGDARATDGLTAALEDTDSDVRRQAAWALGVVVRHR